AVALMLWLVVPQAIDQVGQALNRVPTSRQELNRQARHSTGFKHELLVGVQKRLKKLPAAGSLFHGAVAIGLKAFEALVGILFVFAVAAYWIFERDRTIRLVLSLAPSRHRQVIRDTWELLDLVGVTAVGLLFGAFYVLLATPLLAVLVTLVDVVVRDKDPAEENVPTLLFAKEREA